MNTDIRKIVVETGLIRDHAHIVLGLSGGPDSVCLFDVLKSMGEEYGITIHPVHVNHMLRPGAADRDQAYVEALCREHGLPLKVVTFDCTAAAAEQGLTSEEAGRKARYDAFREMAREAEAEGAAKEDILIAVAHNADDQAETILFRLLRGTGTEGLAGMETVREDESGYRIIRPLLTVSREQIEEYNREHGLSPCIDATNLQPLYARNRIRLELIPQMEKYNPRIREAVNRLGKSAAEDCDYLGEQAEQAYQQMCLAEGDREIRFAGKIRGLHPAVRRRVFGAALEKLGLTEDVTAAHYEAIGDILESSSPSAEADLPRGYQVRREYEDVIVCALARTGSVEARIREMTLAEYQDLTPVQGLTAAFDRDRLAPLAGEDPAARIRVRTREAGDTLAIRGGRKKLQDVFVDEKIPRQKRDLVRLAALGNDVIFIPAQPELGVRARYAAGIGVSSATKTVIVVEFIVNP